MPRPRRFRIVRNLPRINYFKPQGVPLNELKEIILSVSEYEAIRLKDLKNLDQAEAAKKMNISQPTFHRLVLTARKKIANAIVSGAALKIEGGVYRMVEPRRGQGFGRGAPMYCICPVCKHQQNKIPGVPCSQMKCEKCGALMIRGN